MKNDPPKLCVLPTSQVSPFNKLLTIFYHGSATTGTLDAGYEDAYPPGDSHPTPGPECYSQPPLNIEKVLQGLLLTKIIPNVHSSRPSHVTGFANLLFYNFTFPCFIH